MPLTDIVVAKSGEAGLVAESTIPYQTWPGMDAKGIEHIKLGQLLSILAGEPYQNCVIGEFTLLHEASDDGPWVYRIPDRLIDHLIQIDPSGLDQLAYEWSQIEAFALDAWQPDMVASVLIGLHSLAREARGTGKDLLMWVSL
jgi:hypothetical protein